MPFERLRQTHRLEEYRGSVGVSFYTRKKIEEAAADIPSALDRQITDFGLSVHLLPIAAWVMW